MLLKRELLSTVRPAVTDADTRYTLSSIQINPNGAVVATNGHILIKATELHPIPNADFPVVPGVPECVTDPTAPILLPADLADRLIKAMPKRSSLPALYTVSVTVNGDGSAYAAATDLQAPTVAKLTPEEGQTFPAYDRVFPDKDRPVVSILLGIPVLEVLIKSAKAAGAKGIKLALPTQAKYQETDTDGKDHAFNPVDYRDRDHCNVCGESRKAHERPTGLISSQITATYRGSDVDAIAVVMPMRE
jgi:hypothetical protein